MAKDPAMLFYTSDFLTGVTLLSMKERGQYITLLCLQQQMGHMTLKQMKTAVGTLSPSLLSKFVTDDEGKLYNRRAEIEIKKRASHCKKQKENIEKRWNIPEGAFGNTVEHTTVLPLENENESTTPTLEDKSNYLRRGECEGGELGTTVSAYMDKLGILSSSAISELTAYHKELGTDVMLHALEVGLDNGKRSWAYIKAILRRYKRDGLTTLERIKTEEADYKDSKVKKGDRDAGYRADTEQGDQFHVKYAVGGE